MTGFRVGNRAKCTTCGKQLRSVAPGECWKCRTSKGAKGAASQAPKPKAPVKVTTRKLKGTWLERFTQLHEALGLDGSAALEEYCRAWVEATTARALGQLAKPVKLYPRRTAEPAALVEGTGG
jgi:hypothetical protein